MLSASETLGDVAGASDSKSTEPRALSWMRRLAITEASSGNITNSLMQTLGRNPDTIFLASR